MATKTTKTAPKNVSKTPAKKTVTVAKAAPKTSRAKAPAARAAAPVATVVKPTITAEQHHEMVRLEAYLLAERNGFQGDASGYWRAAELQVAGTLGR